MKWGICHFIIAGKEGVRLCVGIFHINFFFDIGTMRKMGILCNNYGGGSKLVMVLTDFVKEFAVVYKSFFANKY